MAVTRTLAHHTSSTDTMCRRSSGLQAGVCALAILAVAVVIALAGSACDDGSKPATTPTSVSTAAEQSIAAGHGTPVASDGTTAEFNEGVASGDVTASSAILWTRARGGDAVAVDLAEDETFGQNMRSEEVQTSDGKDFTVKLKVDGLQPATRYFYRFRAGAATSVTGTFVTPPDPSVSQPLRFVFTGDSDGSRHSDGSPVYNNFEVLDKAAAEDPAFFLYFGDTIYADRTPNATTLDEYRRKYKNNRAYPALTDILAKTATYNTWDDHEVVDNFAGTTVDRERFEAGRQAFQEYMPIDTLADEGANSPEAKMYREIRWGKDVDLILLDERSFRDGEADGACTAVKNADPIPGVLEPGVPDNIRGIRAFVGLPADLPGACLQTLDDSSRTMLGEEQKRFLKGALTSSDATWKVIVNEVPVQQLLALPYDRWEGYAAERREVLEFIRDSGIKNVVFLTTDFHANIFGPVRINAFDGAPPVAYEAIAGPIATTPLQRDLADAIGEQASGAFGALLTGIIHVDCAQLDSYAYAVVDINPAGTMTITAKDASGKVLCNKQLEAEP